MKTVRTSVILIVASLIAPGIGPAEEGILADGQRVEGALGADAQGRVLFQPLGKKLPLRLDQLDSVRFPARRLPPLRAAAVCRVVLPGAQHLTGEFLGLDAEKIQLRTTWSNLLSIPRPGVIAVTHAPGFATVFVDNFENNLKCWRVTGAASLSSKQHVSGQRALCLDTPGQQVEYTLPAPLTAGRVGINFQDRAQDGGMAWHLEAEFGNSAGCSTLRVGVVPQTGDYTAEVSGLAPAKCRLPRTLLAFSDGWQRLDVEFGPARWVLSIDEDILWSCPPSELGGTLCKVRLSCTGSSSADRRGPGVFFDDFSVARALPDLPHSKGDPQQDELWLLGGDQLFGNVVRATGGMIQLQSTFGPRSFGWDEVRGIYFRQQAALTREAAGKHVRVWLRPGSGLEPDVLNGTVRQLDPQRLVLDHELLGRVEIDRRRLHRLRALVEGHLVNESRGP